MCFFFFQAEDGIRDHCVTGVQTCALPIFDLSEAQLLAQDEGHEQVEWPGEDVEVELELGGSHRDKTRGGLRRDGVSATVRTPSPRARRPGSPRRWRAPSRPRWRGYGPALPRPGEARRSARAPA